MKKLFLFLCVCIAVSLAMACSTTGSNGGTTSGRTTSNRTDSSTKGLIGVPDFVNAAYMKASQDVLVGVGAYKVGNDASRISSAKTYAESRARADISRQLISVVRNMIDDYFANSEYDEGAASSFQESVTRSLSQSALEGSRIIEMQTYEGVLWVVVEYGKAFALNEYNAAEAQAKLAIPAAANVRAQLNMEEAFNKLAGGGSVPITE